MALRMVGNVCRLSRTVAFSRSPSIMQPKLCLKSTSIWQTFPMASNFSTKLPEIATYEEIKNLSKKRTDILLIDVRQPKELADTGIVPLSINIPLGQVGEKLSKDFSDSEFLKLFNRKKPTHDTELIFMCRIGKRSHNAMEVSRQLGYKNSRNYLGSWIEWAAKEGLPN